ncbi:MAG: YebC/PmpR family DNA-binding transcriptional regulator [Sulfobacillus sp.]
MSGHSKWANIKRKKAVVDAQRGQAFSKLAREITVAARHGGGNPEANFRLKAALAKAKEYNLPQDNIERAIQRGVGAVSDGAIEEIIYEGYGPGGAALLLECISENRNRTAGEVRHLLSRYGGRMGEAGSVVWQFDAKAVLRLTADPDEILEPLLEAGAEDLQDDGSQLLVLGPSQALQQLTETAAASGATVVAAELEWIAQLETDLSTADQDSLLELIEALEELDDVQAVWTNAKFTESP